MTLSTKETEPAQEALRHDFMATKPQLPTVQDELEAIDREHALVNVIARAAADPNTDVDKLERLLAMQERVLEREAERAFNTAMREAQSAMGPVRTNKKNNETHSTYADLEQVSRAMDPIIHEHGFSLSFGTGDCPYPNHYRVTCAVSHTGGFTRNYQADVPVDNTGPKGSQNKTMTHGFGSALSYGRRYLKLLVFDIATTDDDGRAAGKKNGLINDAQLAVINGLCDAVKADKIAFCKFLKVDSLRDLAADDYNEAIHVLKQKNQAAARDYLTGGK
jgi:hypothetical protein